MSKVVIISSDEKARKKVKTHVPACQLEFEGENDGEDRISKLPNEIIVPILSLMTVREVVCTSVLSRGWRYIWTYVYNLNFDATKILHDWELHFRTRTHFKDVHNYVNLVKHVMSSHQAPSVELLRIRFDVGTGKQNYRDHVQKWIVFAIEKRVKRLDIDLSSIAIFHTWEPHPFPRSDFKSLVALRLASFNITGETLENILLNCQLLERLSVRGSMRLVNLKVTGPSLQLKYLEIYWCGAVEKLEINAENLKTLKYGGRSIDLALTYAPRLVELYFGGDFHKFFIDNIPQFSSYLPQLETLGLDMLLYFEKRTGLCHFPVIGNLKQLEVKLSIQDRDNLFGLIFLFKVLPFLQKFSFWLSCCPSRREDREIMEAEKFRHNHLKIVEIHGFIGHAIDIEFTTYFIENTVALEKIIIDCATIDCFRADAAKNFKENRDKISARKQARILGKRLPPGVTMIIQ